MLISPKSLSGDTRHNACRQMEEDEEEALRKTPELMHQNDDGLYALASLDGRWWTLETSGCGPFFLQVIF